MRAVIFLLLVVLVFLIVRFTLNRVIEIREKQKQQELKQQEQQNTEKPQSQDMVRCAHCGVHVPQSEAYYDGKDTFCSEGHMQAFHDKKQGK